MSKILDIIYPPKCAICGKIEKKYVCEKCLKIIKNEENFRVEKTKRTSQNYFDEHIYLFEYKTIIREKIIEYKYQESSYLYQAFTNILKNNEKMCAILRTYDIITPVPMYLGKKKIRGYNQTELIAKALGQDIKYIKLLEKIRNTRNQMELSKEERLKNLQGAYKVIPRCENSIKQKRILIFDDVFTTGSTANECAKELRKYRPEKVGILTIAKDL